jgi:hypothetical protein
LGRLVLFVRRANWLHDISIGWENEGKALQNQKGWQVRLDGEEKVSVKKIIGQRWHTCSKLLSRDLDWGSQGISIEISRTEARHEKVNKL